MLGMKLNIFSFLAAILVLFTYQMVDAKPFAKQRFPTLDLEWTFPISRPHAGPILGNGNMGIMVWGDSTLNITFSLAGFWDHRGGKPFPENLTYNRLKNWLQLAQEDSLRLAFGEKNKNTMRPQQLGGGRMVLKFPKSHKLERAVLKLAEGEIEVWFKSAIRTEKLTIRMERNTNLVYILRPFYEPKDKFELRLIPMGELAKDAWHERNLPKPTNWKEGNSIGFWQSLPEDVGMVAACEQKGKAIFLAADFQQVLNKKTIASAWAKFNEISIPTKNKRWWSDFWRTVPAFSVPDPDIQEIGEYGLYKMACVASPQAPAVTLQGPFMEDYKLAPWSNDYHFNVNAQMIYEPFAASNLSAYQKPLWDFLKKLQPGLEENGQKFFQRPSILLPHAVDNRGQIPSSFWSGTIDQGCGAWMALMAWRQYKYTGDMALLRQFAHPFMLKNLQGFRAMMVADTAKSGFAFCLPASVSPEFKGNATDAWGKNASYQLAACRALALAIREACKTLAEPEDALIDSVIRFLPAYLTVVGPKTLEFPQYTSMRIGLWEEQDLVESHRHHSHLAGIAPFRSVAWEDSANKSLISNSIYHWSRLGFGAWAGWSVPWAASIYAKVDQPDAAISLLHWWKLNFTNEGRGTLHDIAFPYVNTTSTRTSNHVSTSQDKEKMQLDAGFGALQALYDLFIRNTNAGLYVLPTLPSRWENLEFDGLLAEGGFLVGATVAEKQVQQIRIKSLRSQFLRLHLPFNRYTVNGHAKSGKMIQMNMGAGEVLVIQRN